MAVKSVEVAVKVEVEEEEEMEEADEGIEEEVDERKEEFLNLARGPVGLIAPKLAKTSNRPIGDDKRSAVDGFAYIRASAAASASAAEDILGRVDTVPDQCIDAAPPTENAALPFFVFAFFLAPTFVDTFFLFLPPSGPLARLTLLLWEFQ